MAAFKQNNSTSFRSNLSEGNEDLKKSKIPLNYGLGAGVLLIALFLVYYYTGWDSVKDFRGLVPYISFMVLVVLSQFAQSKAIDRPIKFGDLFATGFKTTAVTTSIYVLFMVVFILLVPEYKEKMLELTHQGFIDQGMEEDVVQSNMDKFKSHFLSYSIGTYIFRMMVQGLIAAFIGAIAAPKNKEPRIA